MVRCGGGTVFYNLLIKTQSFSESVSLVCDHHKYFFLCSSLLFQWNKKAREGWNARNSPPRSHGSLKGRLQKNHFPRESRTLLQEKTWVYFTKVILPPPLLELRGDIPLTFTVNNWWGFLELKVCEYMKAPPSPTKTGAPGVSCSHTNPYSASSNLSALPFQDFYMFIALATSVQISRFQLWFSGFALLSRFWVSVL